MSKPPQQLSAIFNREGQILLVMVLVAFAVRSLFFSGGIRGSDAFAYAQHAYDIATGNYDVNSIYMFYGFRYFVLLPTALSFTLFGVNDLSASISLYLASLVNVVVVFFLSKRIFNVRIAVIASGLLAIYPLDISTANVVSPDSFIPVLSSLAILCCLRAEDAGSGHPRRILWLLLAGVMISFAYMSRVTSIFLFFALAIYQLYHKNYTAILWMTMGLLIPLAAEALYFFAQTGDPFFEIHRITSLTIANTVKDDYDLGLLLYPKNMFGIELSGLAMFGFTWWFVACGLGIMWQKKESAALLVIVCLVIPFLGFEFGFQSLTEGILISKNLNYLSLMTGSAMIIGAYFLNHVFIFIHKRSHARSIPILLICILAIASMHLYGVYRLDLNARNDSAPYIAVADHLISNPGSTVYTHHFRWPLFLNYFLRYDSSYMFKDLNEMTKEKLDNLSNVYVVFHKRYLEADVRGRPVSQDTVYANYEKTPPKNWEKIVSFSGRPPYNSAVLYKVSEIRK